jgi:hypothetical protein
MPRTPSSSTDHSPGDRKLISWGGQLTLGFFQRRSHRPLVRGHLCYGGGSEGRLRRRKNSSRDSRSRIGDEERNYYIFKRVRLLNA